MTILTAVYLWGLSGALLIMMIQQFRHRTHDLLSMRNFFLLGLIIFQTHSAARSLFYDDFGALPVNRPTSSGLEFAGMCTLFIVLFLWLYEWGWMAKPIADRIPSTKATLPDGGLLGLAMVLTALSVVLRFGVRIPLVSIIAEAVGTSLSALACGLVGWVWGRRLLNPALLLYSGLILLAATVSQLTGAFGRRGLVAIFAGLLWGMYYSQWRYGSLGAVGRRLIAIGIVPFIVVGVFTSARGGVSSLSELVTKIRSEGSLTAGAKLLTDGQSTGAAGVWAVETYPESIPYRHLFSLHYFLTYDIPRTWWPDKPWPLSIELPVLSGMRKVPLGSFTVPAGVVGTAAAEGGWYAVAIYAVWMAVFIRFFDQLIQNSVTSPFVVLALGSQLGQVLGMPRGETSAFANVILYSSVLVWVVMLLMGKLVEWSTEQPSELTSVDEPALEQLEMPA